MSDPVSEYNALLEDEALAAASAEVLRAGQQSARLTFGERPLSITLRPNLMNRTRYEQLAGASHALYSALNRLQRALLESPTLRAELDLLPEEERLALVDPGFRSASPSARLDGFFSDRIRYVEYNAESPAGMAYGDNLTAVFERLPVMRRFRKRYRLRALPTRARQLAAMLRAFRQWGGDRPVIAIVDWGGLPTATEFEMFSSFFESRGVRTVICDPRSLTLRGGTLHADDGTAVNLVYRRVLTSELLARADEVQPLLQAYVEGAACVVNSFRAKLLHKKMSLALLSDDRHAGLYTADQRRAINLHIPWTRKVRAGRVRIHGRHVDLIDLVARSRETMVLKPNDDYGGRGVILGWQTSQLDWEQALKTALEQSYVVQEAVPVPQEAFPVALDGVQLVDLSLDFDPYLFDGRVGGCMTRLSSSALLNVTAGAGSIVPTYLVEGKT